MKSYEEYESELDHWLRKRPKCEKCGEHIQDDYTYSCHDYKVLCENCFDEWAEEIKKDGRERIDE